VVAPPRRPLGDRGDRPSDGVSAGNAIWRTIPHLVGLPRGVVPCN
jgi:hypothetical protein